MYEAVRARPAGPSTVARLAATAADDGYDGLVVCNPPDATPTYDAAAIEAAVGVDVVAGMALAPASPAEAGGGVGHHRPETTVVAIEAGDAATTGWAVRQPKVDVLARPMADAVDLDHVLVRTAADHGVRLEVDLGPVLRSSGPARSAAIARLRKQRELLEDADAPYVVSGRPDSHLALRSPRDLAAVAATAGFDREAVERGLAEWGRLAARNRERLSDAYVEPGVRRGAWAGEGAAGTGVDGGPGGSGEGEG